MQWTTGLGMALAAVGAVTSVPQVLRTVRTRDTDAVSLSTQLAWVASWLLWVWYSVQVGAYPKATAELVGLSCDATLLVLLLVTLHRSGGSVRRAVARSSWVLAGVPVLLAAGMLGGPVALAVGLAGYDAVTLAPQLVRTLRARSLHGLSLSTWSLRCLTASGWIGYGFGIGHPEAAGWTFAMLPAAVFVVARILVSRHRAAATG